MSRWVQHISGQGEKWSIDVYSDEPQAWRVELANSTILRLPKSEYRLCEPPEVWRDVTGECEAPTETWPSRTYSATNGIVSKDGLMLWVGREDHAKGYRLRKVRFWTVQPNTNILGEAHWAFIVEKREP